MIRIKTSKQQEMIDITEQVNKKINIKEGVCHIYSRHTTAAVIINENWDPNICKDIFKALNNAIPKKGGYKHDKVDGNAQSHILASIFGPGEVVPVRDGKLELGRWQAVMLVELDGPKERNIQVTCTEI